MEKGHQLYIISREEMKSEIATVIGNAFEKYSKKINKPKEQKDWISRKNVCEMLGISLVTLSSWTKQGILTSYKIGNQIRYIREEVELAITKTT